MIRKTSILAALTVFGLASFVSAANNANTKVVYVGGHNPATMIRTEPATRAPYALTGTQRTETGKSIQTENIWIGSRFAGARVVEK